VKDHTPTLGSLVHGFFAEYLTLQRGVRPATVRSYRDGLRLFLRFVARDRGRKITGLEPSDLTFERVLSFLRHLEKERSNHPRTRNQRLAVLHGFFEYVAERMPELLATAQRVAAIRPKLTPPPEPHHLERDQLRALFEGMREGPGALRDRTLLLFLYNTGARAQEASDLRVGHLDLGSRPHARLHGKGDKWRVCPLWKDTAGGLSELLRSQATQGQPEAPVFVSGRGGPLSRFGIYKIVRRHAAPFDGPPLGPDARRVTPSLPTTTRHLNYQQLL
jgi:site-specific recombinase XerD